MKTALLLLVGALLTGANALFAQEVGPRTVPVEEVLLEEPHFSRSLQTFTRLTPGAQQIHGHEVSVVLLRRGGAIEVSAGEVSARTVRGRPLVLRLPGAASFELIVTCVRLPGWLREGEDGRLAWTWIAFPRRAERIVVRGESLLGLDLDGDGQCWEVGQDGVVRRDDRWVSPLTRSLIFGPERIGIERLSGEEGQVRVRGLELMRGIDGNAREIAAAMAWNARRTAAGLEPAWLDPQLSRDCAAHCAYLKANPRRNISAHDQDPGKPGYSAAGRKAGLASCIAFDDDAVREIVDFSTTLYHKRPLFLPRTRRIGIAARDGHTLADGLSGLDRSAPASWPITLPGHEQVLRDRRFRNEAPDPLPEKTETAGSAILLMFQSWNTPTEKVAARLRRIGPAGALPRDIPFWLSSPDAPANPARAENDGCICLIPWERLEPGRSYEVRVDWSVRGKAHSWEWVFHTAPL